MHLAGGRGGEGFRVGVDGGVDAEGGDPGGPADRLAAGGELAVLLGFERHRGQLTAVGTGDLVLPGAEDADVGGVRGADVVAC
jgi:hypothetical protein